MIFTIGHQESYDLYFEEQETPKKLGRHKGYSGGSVWQSIEKAEQHCPSDFTVYGVLADWENDTEKSIEGDWHDLLVDADLVKLQ